MFQSYNQQFIQTFVNVDVKSNEQKDAAASLIGTNSDTSNVTAVLHCVTTVSSTKRGSSQKFNSFYFNFQSSQNFLRSKRRNYFKAH